MKYFLKDVKEGSIYNMEDYLQEEGRSFLNDLEAYWGIRKEAFQDKFKVPAVLVVGKTGTGKSSLCNLMAGLPPYSD
jgi:putative ribosome biogenesis GTPase RsgA